MALRKFALIALLAMLPLAARAQMLNVTDITKLVGAPAGTIGTSAVLVVPQMQGGGSANASQFTGVPARWTTLYIGNPSASATIYCSYSASVAANTGKPIQAGQSLSWDLTFPAPQNQPIYCVASGASTPFQADVGSP